VSHDLERIRDYVEGRLPPAEREAFAEELREDATLAELVEAYRMIVCATSDGVPASETTYPQVLARAGARRRRPLVLLAAAAALLLALGGAWLLAPRPKPPPVLLAAIPLARLPAPPAPPEWPRELLDHATADEDGLLWYGDLDRALAVSRAAGRPVFLFVDFPGCPLCEQFRAGPCRDRRVTDAAADFILLNLPWPEAPEELRKPPNEGWPIYAVLDPQGKRIGGFTGMRSVAELAGWLKRTSGALREDFAFPGWDALGREARRLDEAEREQDPARRYGLYRQVAAGEGLLAEVARAHLLALEKEAQDALLGAQGLAPDAAAARLAAAAAALRGTPYADDLERVLAHLREHGSFPELKEKT
jgi:hypothetical protein